MTAAPIVDATASRRRSRVFITRYLAPALPSEALRAELWTHRVPSNGFPRPTTTKTDLTIVVGRLHYSLRLPPKCPFQGEASALPASSLCFLVPRYQFASRTLGVGGIGGQYRTFPIHPRPPPIDEGHEPLIGPAQLAVLPFEHPFLIPVLASERRPAPSWQQTSARSLRCGRRFACRNTKRVASRGDRGPGLEGAMEISCPSTRKSVSAKGG